MLMKFEVGPLLSRSSHVNKGQVDRYVLELYQRIWRLSYMQGIYGENSVK